MSEAGKPSAGMRDADGLRPRDAALPIALAGALVTLSHWSFLWFHTVAEFFAIVVGASLYLLASRSYILNHNGLLLFLAQGFFWAAGVDAVHTLAYSGMGLVPGDDANPATQLWVIARLLEAATLLLAPRFLDNRPVPGWSFPLFGALATLAVLLVFAGGLPAAFRPGLGLTLLKVGAEYFIIGLLAAAAWRLHRHRPLLDPGLYRSILAVIALTITSELAFTAYAGVYDLANLSGHILKFWAFWLLLLTISRWMIGAPFRLLSRDATSFDSVPLPVLLVDAAGRIQSCNEAARRQQPDSGLGSDLHTTWHPAHQPAGRCPVCQALAAGQATEADLFDPHRGRWTAVHVRPVRQGDGTAGFVCVHNDVTESHRARDALTTMNQALVNLNEEIQDLYDRAPCAYHSLDANGVFVRINQTELDMLGYRREEMIGRMRFTDVLTPASRELFERSFPAFKEQGSVDNLEFEIIRKDGSRFVCNLSATAIRDTEGRYLASRSTFMDISHRKRAEERLIHAEKMEAIGELTGGLAHDFNNLLGIILGSLDLLAPRLGDDERARHKLDLAVRAARRAADVTRSLLAVARKQALEPRNLDINETLTELLPLIRQTLGKGIVLHHTPCGSCAGHQARVDPAGLGNALLNLVINARDALPAGGDLRIDVRLHIVGAEEGMAPADLPAGHYIVISVSDNGCGMPGEVAARAFEPFFTTKEQGKGTGLGLAMVYGFAHQSGGTVRLYSQPRRGTTVRLYLPAVSDGGSTPRPAEPAPAPQGRGQRILLVDDEQGLLDVAGAWLQALGYRVTPVRSAAAALNHLASADTDLLLTDVMMPGEMDGVALANRVAALRRELPILLSSGLAGDMIQAPWPVLQKPYSRSELATEVARALGTPVPGDPQDDEVSR